MFNKILNILKIYINHFLSENSIIYIQRKLIGADIFLKTDDVLVLIIVLMIFILIISMVLFLFLNISLLFSLLLTILVPILFSSYVYYKNEKRLEQIELDLPDYLRQLSALIKVGYGIESAFNELSKTMHNSLNDEIKRALLETSFGKPFNESLKVVQNNYCSGELTKEEADVAIEDLSKIELDVEIDKIPLDAFGDTEVSPQFVESIYYLIE